MIRILNIFSLETAAAMTGDARGRLRFNEERKIFSRISTGRVSSIDSERGAGVDARLGFAGDGTALVDRDEVWDEAVPVTILKGRPGGRLGLDGERVDFAILGLELDLEMRTPGRTRSFFASFFARVTRASPPWRGAMAYHSNAQARVYFPPPPLHPCLQRVFHCRCLPLKSPKV